MGFELKDAKQVARGNSKVRDRKPPVPGNRTLMKADAKVAEEQKNATQDRLKLCNAQICWLDQHLVKLTMMACEGIGPVEFERHKKQVDVAVKLRDSWEKALRRCQIALGIVTERAERTAKSRKAASGEDEFQRLQREFEAGG